MAQIQAEFRRSCWNAQYMVLDFREAGEKTVSDANIYLSIYLSIYILSIYPPSIYPFIYLSIYLSNTPLLEVRY